MLYCFKNGEIVTNEEATVHVSDLGMLRSYAAFDYLRTYNGRPFRLPDHLARFRNSANGLMLPLRYSDDEISNTIFDLLDRSGLAEAAVRLVITGGNSPDSMTVTDPNFFIIVERLPEYPAEYWEKGVTLITSEYQRDVPTLKSTGYLNAVKLMPSARQQGAYEVLYCHEGRILELTRHNFFLFHEDTLLTPFEDVLPGITRKVVLELVQGVFPVEERNVSTEELRKASEAFLCGTTTGVMPVVQVDDNPVGSGKPGPNTRRLIDLFGAYTART